jgi:prephenate dehydratase
MAAAIARARSRFLLPAPFHVTDHTAAITHVPRVAFQGELGAFSEMAIRQQWPTGATPVPCLTFPDVLAQLTRGHAEFAVVPVENAIVGPVTVALTALDAVADRVEVRGETRVPVHLCLMAPAGATLAGLRDIHSHPVALAQCRIFFARHSWLASRPHADTAGAAREVAMAGDLSQGAVASAMAAERYGLEIIARHIEDVPLNWTRFVVVSPRLA